VSIAFYTEHIWRSRQVIRPSTKGSQAINLTYLSHSHSAVQIGRYLTFLSSQALSHVRKSLSYSASRFTFRCLLPSPLCFFSSHLIPAGTPHPLLTTLGSITAISFAKEEKENKNRTPICNCCIPFQSPSFVLVEPCQPNFLLVQIS